MDVFTLIQSESIVKLYWNFTGGNKFRKVLSIKSEMSVQAAHGPKTGEPLPAKLLALLLGALLEGQKRRFLAADLASVCGRHGRLAFTVTEPMNGAQLSECWRLLAEVPIRYPPVTLVQ